MIVHSNVDVGYDTLNGGAGNDTLNGGTGAGLVNTLSGGEGDDLYLVGSSDGGDFGIHVINETQGHDVLAFDSSISLSELTFSKSDDNLLIAYGPQTGVFIHDYFSLTSDSVEEVIVAGEQVSITEPELGVDLLIQSMSSLDGGSASGDAAVVVPEDDTTTTVAAPF